MFEYKTLRNGAYRLSAYIGEVAVARASSTESIGEMRGINIAPYGREALLPLGDKDKAIAALAKVAECALGMAENIDEWWER